MALGSMFESFLINVENMFGDILEVFLLVKVWFYLHESLLFESVYLFSGFFLVGWHFRSIGFTCTRAQCSRIRGGVLLSFDFTKN